MLLNRFIGFSSFSSTEKRAGVREDKDRAAALQLLFADGDVPRFEPIVDYSEPSIWATPLSTGKKLLNSKSLLYEVWSAMMLSGHQPGVI